MGRSLTGWETGLRGATFTESEKPAPAASSAGFPRQTWTPSVLSSIFLEDSGKIIFLEWRREQKKRREGGRELLEPKGDKNSWASFL